MGYWLHTGRGPREGVTCLRPAPTLPLRSGRDAKTLPLQQATGQWALHLTKTPSGIFNLYGRQLSGHSESEIYIRHSFQHMETISIP